MKFFLAIFSIFGLYFLYPAEARAELVRADSGNVFAQQTDSSLENSHPENKSTPHPEAWQSWAYVGGQENQIIHPQGFWLSPITKIFRTIGAKEFQIRTGLSPPLLLVKT